MKVFEELQSVIFVHTERDGSALTYYPSSLALPRLACGAWEEDAQYAYGAAEVSK